MLKASKRKIAVMAALITVGAPAPAYAAFNLAPGDPISPAAPAAALTASPVQGPSASSSQGFQWDDAGIGAAAMLVLVGAGTAVTRRLRGQQIVAR